MAGRREEQVLSRRTRGFGDAGSAGFVTSPVSCSATGDERRLSAESHVSPCATEARFVLSAVGERCCMLQVDRGDWRSRGPCALTRIVGTIARLELATLQ